MAIYEDALCPLPGCGAVLYITWSASRPVFLNDTVADLKDPVAAYTTGWEIGCETGHTILLPLNGNENEEFGENDDDEPNDLERLHVLLEPK